MSCKVRVPRQNQDKGAGGGKLLSPRYPTPLPRDSGRGPCIYRVEWQSHSK